MKRAYMGIDVGTTNVKAAAFDEKGDLLAYRSAPTPIVHPQPQFSEFEPEALWLQVAACIRSVLQQIGPTGIVSVAVSSMGEAGLLLDRDGAPLCNIIAWYDTRSVPQYERLQRALGRDRLYRITGAVPASKYGIAKLMWLHENCPEIAERGAHWLSVEDYILWRLSGVYATDYSMAARTMAFDIHTLDWSEEIIRAAGVPKELFPRPWPGGTQIGGTTSTAALECGLPVGVPVCTGGHDHACAAIAVDITQDGVCMDSMGTAEASMMALDAIRLPPKDMVHSYSVYPHCGRRLYRVISSNQSCGVCIEWALRTFRLSEAPEAGKSRYDILLDGMEDVQDLFFFPFLRGTVECTGAGGAFIGLHDGHSTGQIVSALVDGLCYELKRQIEEYESIFGAKMRALRVVGGLSKSRQIMARKSRIQGVTVSVPANTEAACLGAAFLGAVGAGHMDWSQSLFRVGTEYAPEAHPEDAARYDRYARLRKGLLNLYSEVTRHE